MTERWDARTALPNDRPLSDSEIAVVVAQAILHDRLNPGQNQPFQPHVISLLAHLGVPDGGTHDRAWRQKFFEVNRNPDLNFRLAEYCWRLVGLGYLVPQLSGDWGAFYPTERGREFLEQLDPVALTHEGLDAKLGALGIGPNDLPRKYARLAQECFLAGHYESAIVMLGAASEALVDELANALTLASSTAMLGLRARPRRATARQDIDWISEALTLHKKQIQMALRAKGADEDWIDTLNNVLAGTGQAIRLTRNEFGHPTGITADQTDALQLLVLFPRFAEGCKRATDALAKL